MTDYIERRGLFNALYDAEAITVKGIEILRNFPAADVVPVVRCEYCGGKRWCNFRQWLGEDGYCSRGRVKDGDE